MDFPSDGTKTVEHLDSFWEVGCPFHRGREQVGSETRIDPETGEPRVALLEVVNEDGAPVHNDDGSIARDWQIVYFPVWSGDLGHQQDCDNCKYTWLQVKAHMAAVDSSAEQAAFESGQRLKEQAAQAGMTVEQYIHNVLGIS
jgi:hypothetical protein